MQASLNHWKNRILSGLSRMMERFPIGVILIIMNLILIGMMIEQDGNATHELTRLLMTSVGMLFLSVTISLIAERRAIPRPLLWQLLILLYGGILYFWSDVPADWIGEKIAFVAMQSIGLFTLMFVAPFLLKRGESFQREEEIRSIISMSSGLVRAIFLSVATMILGMIALTSVIELFDLRGITAIDHLYGHWLSLTLVWLGPILFLIHLPDQKYIRNGEINLSHFFAIVLKWIWIPFLFLYFAILYAYSIKVLFDLENWPKGVITWMIIGFSSFWYLAYWISGAYEESISTIKIFRRTFPYIVLPELMMLAYAIALRIDQYDLTVNRYFVVLFGIWLLGISLYLIFSKTKRVSILPYSLGLISILFSIGPWSVFDLPYTRQYDRLIEDLSAANILSSDGTLTPISPQITISSELSQSISSRIDYLCGYRNCRDVIALFSPLPLTPSILSGEYSRWEVTNEIREKLGVNYQNSQNDVSSRFRQFSIKNAYQEPFPLTIPAGTSSIVRIYSITEIKNLSKDQFPAIAIDPEKRTIGYYTEVWSGSSITIDFDTELQKYDVDQLELDPKLLTFDVTLPSENGENLTAKLLLRNYAIVKQSQTGKEETYFNPTINGLALIK